MTEKELLKKLNNLRIIKPAAEWKKESRDILLRQIAQGEPIVPLSRFGLAVEFLKNTFPFETMRKLPQPVWAIVLILFFALGGGVIGLKAARDTKPGDSLYIAKIISEKTRLSFTFDDKKEAKLALEFAGNRAKEITQVLVADENGGKEKKVEKLSDNFKKEINTAKKKLGKMMVKNINSAGQEKTEETKVFGANLGKEDRGMQLSPQENNETAVGGGEKQEEIATSTASEIAGEKNAEGALIEAEKLFDEKNYDATLNKLEEAGKAIDKEVAGEGANSDSPSTNSGQGGNATTTGE
ncbi:hypothetical protein HY798_04795 [Candidatus Falkowbacteria bacterium]|nr:hypothetical protein [Candidatus Falkowbacteria bacterium]